MEGVLASEFVASRYTVGKVLGHGAFSACYQADDRDEEQAVVLKITSLSAATKAGARARRIMCERECAVLRSLAHPNVVECYGFCAAAAGHYVAVLECLDGASLDDLIRGFGALPEARVREMARGLCGGLRHLHSHGVLHRDVKTDNVIVVGADAEERAVLIDFGLARTLSASDVDNPDLDSVGSIEIDMSAVGNAVFAAPEVRGGARPATVDGALAPCTSRYGVAADAYSLGRVLRAALGDVFGDAPAPLAEACACLYRALVGVTSKKRRIGSLQAAVSRECYRALVGLTRRDPADRLKLKAFACHPWLGGTTPDSSLSLLACSLDLSTTGRTQSSKAPSPKRGSPGRPPPAFRAFSSEGSLANIAEETTPAPSPVLPTRRLAFG